MDTRFYENLRNQLLQSRYITRWGIIDISLEEGETVVIKFIPSKHEYSVADDTYKPGELRVDLKHGYTALTIIKDLVNKPADLHKTGEAVQIEILREMIESNIRGIIDDVGLSKENN